MQTEAVRIAVLRYETYTDRVIHVLGAYPSHRDSALCRSRAAVSL